MIKFIDKKNKTVKFHTLNVGDTFKSPNFSAHYMKCECVVNTNGAAYNSINLDVGLLMRFNNTDDVYPISLTVEVEH